MEISTYREKMGLPTGSPFSVISGLWRIADSPVNKQNRGDRRLVLFAVKIFAT
jgi:hypothetical protein